MGFSNGLMTGKKDSDIEPLDTQNGTKTDTQQQISSSLGQVLGMWESPALTE